MTHPSTFYIADIHGTSGLLRQMLDHIGEYAAKAGIEPRVTFLGDIVDRGPASKLLLGNHDDLLLQSYKIGEVNADVRHWLFACGGDETLASYGFTVSRQDHDAFGSWISTMKHEFPHHLELLESASLSSHDGPFFACHAGINAWTPLDRQNRFDLLWIREGFLDRVDDRMAPVIHGHSIVGNDPVMTENRISLDTGAYRSGRLTCLFVDLKDVGLCFFQTGPKGVSQTYPALHDRGKGTIADRIDELFPR
jgi:serine/threonine protein phosphatase 1